MDKLDRFQRLHRIFQSHKYPVSLSKIAKELDCSEKTARRLIDAIEDHWGVPVEKDESGRGWYINRKKDDKFELPGLWLTTDELQSLTALLNILHSMDDGLVLTELTIVEKTIRKLLEARGINASHFTNSIKYLPMAKRATQPRIFNIVANGLLNKQQIQIRYRDYRGKASERDISPQQLIYYRENWLVDAWCHLRKDLRTFSISRIEQAFLIKEAAKQIDNQTLKDYFASSYGIFSGKAKYTARLLFSPEVAREIAAQLWHPEQKGEWQGKEYLLEIPYNKEAELVMDILKYGNNVEVLGPSALRKAVFGKLRSALAMYSDKVGWA